ncbi:unnamed protein product [Acidithrix sp. C25]|nr:unnamed protein product [Acidithrix sp. C25]
MAAALYELDNVKPAKAGAIAKIQTISRHQCKRFFTSGIQWEKLEPPALRNRSRRSGTK